jgi:hypothetical protein
MRYQITISRYTAEDRCTRENWKDLISSLALCGFEVYADEERIVFETGGDEKVKEIKETIEP